MAQNDANVNPEAPNAVTIKEGVQIFIASKLHLQTLKFQLLFPSSFLHIKGFFPFNFFIIKNYSIKYFLFI